MEIAFTIKLFFVSSKYCYAHFTDGRTEAWRDEIIYQSLTDTRPRVSDSKALKL